MSPSRPLPLIHSWPLFGAGLRFDLGHPGDADPMERVLAAMSAAGRDAFATSPLGAWECDLTDNSLTWSDEVYDLFGLPRGAPVSRAEAVALYAESSRAVMERLRVHAIRHRRGFTVDVELRPADGARRWMRLVAAPLIESGRVVRLHGLKQDVSPDYGLGIVPGRR